MAGYDRDEVLARTDLAVLATEICGPPSGHGRAAKWHCPNPDHPDTHPSMTVFDGRRAPRWKCHACGEGGTAIDLWVISQRVGVGDAIAALGERAGVAGVARTTDAPARLTHLLGSPTPATTTTSSVPPPDPGVFDGRVEDYVAAAAALLWGVQGGGALEWLHQRGFADEVLRVNRVGYDPGPRALRRARGLPYRGVGIVLPILGPGDHAMWVQTRYLDPVGAGRKYDSVVTDVAANPRVAVIRTPASPRLGVVVVTEGIPDGLTVAHTGAQPAAVVGTANTGPDVAEHLHDAFPNARFIVAFDNDNAGRATGPKLGGHLAELGHIVVASGPPPAHNDLNDWWGVDPDALRDHLQATGRPPLYPAVACVAVPTPSL